MFCSRLGTLGLVYIKVLSKRTEFVQWLVGWLVCCYLLFLKAALSSDLFPKPFLRIKESSEAMQNGELVHGPGMLKWQNSLVCTRHIKVQAVSFLM